MVGQSMKLGSLFKTKGAPKLPRPCQFLAYCAQANTLSFRKADPAFSDPMSPTFGLNRCTTSPSFSSSVETLDLLEYCNNGEDEHGLEKLVRGVVKSSERLFFEPNGDTDSLTVMPADNRGVSGAEDLEETKYQKERKRKGKEKFEEHDAAAEVSLCESSVFLSLDSNDPYEDFKKSMEEMVEFLGLKDWESLEELLRCYLVVNDEEIYDIILNAFVDLFSIET